MSPAHATGRMLDPPDPHCAGAAFLAWLIKQGGEEESSVCEYQWELSKINHPTPELGNVKLLEYLGLLGRELIVKEGEIIVLTPKGSGWAAKWAILYGVSWQKHMDVFEDCMRRGII